MVHRVRVDCTVPLPYRWAAQTKKNQAHGLVFMNTE
jgi:hypothetical protein